VVPVVGVDGGGVVGVVGVLGEPVEAGGDAPPPPPQDTRISASASASKCVAGDFIPANLYLKKGLVALSLV
jgi:hypothetical protein